MKTSPLSPFLQQSLARINQNLEQLFLNLPAPSERLHAAMQYSSLAGGKRIRALFIYATGHAFQIKPECLDAAALAVELVHTYSLIHDDLPAMDNDDLRRGKPTCHKAFDEASAILAGDALQTLAFEQLSKSNPHLTSTQQLRMIEILTHAIGVQGMASGQALDLETLGKNIDLALLQQIHQLKTGALICACIQLALAAGDVNATEAKHMQHFAEKIGLAFQVQDDLLDVIGDQNDLGKKTGQDAARNKPTYPTLIGTTKTRQLVEQLTAEALTHLTSATTNSAHLQELTHLIIQRKG